MPLVVHGLLIVAAIGMLMSLDRGEDPAPEPISSSISEPAPWAGKSITARYQRLAGAIPPPEWSVLNENAGSWAFSEVEEDSGATLEQAPESAPAAEVRPTPVPTPILAPAHERQYVGVLTREEFYALLRQTDFDPGVYETVYRIACGYPPTSWGESSCKPGEDNGKHIGLLQINHEIWAARCGTTAQGLYDALTNLRCGVVVLNEQGWGAWEVKP